MNRFTTLSEMKQGEFAVVYDLKTKGSSRRRLQDIGLIQGTLVECVQISPLGDPIAYLIRGAVIALRKEDSKHVYVNPL